MNSISTHITYLDTKGRPAITLKYEQLTDRHTGVIYVSTIEGSIVLFGPERLTLLRSRIGFRSQRI